MDCDEHFTSSYLFVLWLSSCLSLFVFLGISVAKWKNRAYTIAPKNFFGLTFTSISLLLLSPTIYGFLEKDKVQEYSMWIEGEGIISLFYVALIFSMFYAYAFLDFKPKTPLAVLYIVSFLILFGTITIVSEDLFENYLSDYEAITIFLCLLTLLMSFQFVKGVEKLAEIGRLFMFFGFPLLPMLTHFLLAEFIPIFQLGETIDILMLLTPFVLFPKLFLKKAPTNKDIF